MAARRLARESKHPALSFIFSDCFPSLANVYTKPSLTTTANTNTTNTTNMRSPLSLISLLVLVLALLASSATAWAPISKKDAGICAKKESDVVQAIAAFCQRAPYLVPGRDARIGRYSKNTDFVVRITGKLLFSFFVFRSSIRRSTPSLRALFYLPLLLSQLIGNCKPTERVSKEWCFRQFYNMCRNGRKNGSSMGKYGGGGCQRWSILEKNHDRPS